MLYGLKSTFMMYLEFVVVVSIVALLLAFPMMLFWNYVVVFIIPTVQIGFVHAASICAFIVSIKKLS